MSYLLPATRQKRDKRIIRLLGSLHANQGLCSVQLGSMHARGYNTANNVYEVEQTLCEGAADERPCGQHGCEDHESQLC